MPVAVSDIRSTLSEFGDHEIIAALKALLHGFVLGQPAESMGGTVNFFVTDTKERGRRAVGLWPSGESADAPVDALRQAEELTEDLEEKTLIRCAAGSDRIRARDVMVDVVAAVVARQSGLG